MSERIEIMDSDGFEHVTQPWEDIKGDVERGVGEEKEEKNEENYEPEDVNDVKDDSGERDSKAVPTDPAKTIHDNRPTWTRMHLRHLSIEVLKDHKIDYVLDDRDPDYVLIQRWVPEYEQDFLWAATRALRTKRNFDHRGSNPSPPPRARFDRASSPGIIEVRRANRGAQLKLDINRIDMKRPGMKDWVGVKYTGQRGKHVLDVALEEGKAVRLAVNSEALRDELRIIVGAGVGLEINEQRNVLLGPWKVLVEYEGAIRQRLQKLEEMMKVRDEKPVERPVEKGDEDSDQLDEEVRSENSEILSRPPPNSCEVCDMVFPPHETPLECLDTRVAHLKCLVEFMDGDLKHVFDLRQQIKDGSLKEIAFADLWHLFSPGDVIVTSPLDRAYRVFYTSGGRPRLSKSELFEKKTVFSPFNINCFHMGYDWKAVGPVHETLRIQEYVGKKPVTELLVELDGKVMVEKVTVKLLKMLSADARKNKIEYLISRAKKLRSLRQGDHKYYSGIAGEETSTSSDDDDVRFARRVPVYQTRFIVDSRKVRELVESHVIIDTELKCENTAIGLFDAIEFDSRETAENCTHYGVPNYQYVSDRFPRECRCSDIVMDHVVDNDRAAKYKDDLHLLQQRDINDELEDDILMLLPPTIEGFVMEKKTWKMLNVDAISDPKDGEVTKQVDFKDLVLPDEHEGLLKALVMAHPSSQPIPSQKTNKTSKFSRFPESANLLIWRIADLTILLHGPKGTGKFLTVKALASHFNRPLYTITGSDLGMNTWDAGRVLTVHFERATKWNCIIAIPEAEYQFPRRKSPTERDFSASGVLLRELELFNGIVILTTDCKNDVEEQVIKGMDVCLASETWNHKDNMAIWHKAWELKIDRSRRSPDGKPRVLFVEETYLYWLEFIEGEYKMGKSWNGMEINNYFDTALALAEYDTDLANRSETPLLKANHLSIAARVTGASVCR
ncbi:hypothetical protein NHQ30_004468 [Ciborinia camelliae]|nr:hypothetical protein NHQ30_004468 [Ciborinia camelliae]